MFKGVTWVRWLQLETLLTLHHGMSLHTPLLELGGTQKGQSAEDEASAVKDMHKWRKKMH